MAGGILAVTRADLWPAGTVTYQMWGTDSPTGHRPDCSGFVSMCWDLPTPGENTETLVTGGFMVEINPVDLAPGDAVGLCGLGTLGSNGHIMLFKHWTETGLAIAEQAGGRDGPIHRTLKRIPSGYLAYRYVGTLEGEDMTPDEAYVQHVINYRTEATIAMRDPIRIPEFESGGKFWGELVEANALARAVRAVAGGGVSAEDVANELAKRLAS